MIRKCLAIGIILLFVGVTIAPTINFSTVKASQDDDLVEVTTQACGIQGYKDTTVKLTREQYQNLEEYLVEFRARLNQTTTREEAVPIFKDAVVELDKYGLLPKGMNIETAMKLVTGGYKSFQGRDILKTLINTNNKMLNENINILCLFTGQTDNSIVLTLKYRLFYIPLVYLAIILFSFSDRPIFFNFCLKLYNLFVDLLIFSPIGFNEWIIFGFLKDPPYGDLIPSHGWVNTVGLNGIKNWNGSFCGYCGTAFDANLIYIGTIDFTGVSLYLDNDERFYLGFSLFVNIENC